MTAEPPDARTIRRRINILIAVIVVIVGIFIFIGAYVSASAPKEDTSYGCVNDPRTGKVYCEGD